MYVLTPGAQLAGGSIHAKSPSGFIQAYFDFNETCWTCWEWGHSSTSQMLRQSEQFFWGGSYGLSNFDMFSKKGYDRHALNPCISGTDGSICTKQVLLERELHILVNYSFELEFDLEIDLVDQVIWTKFWKNVISRENMFQRCFFGVFFVKR